MAESPGGDDSVFDAGRLSLFDLIVERSRAQNKKQLVHRLVYISKIRQDVSDRREVGAHYERLFKDLQAQVHGEPVTGLLMIYPHHMIHVVETSYNMLVKVMKDLEEDEQSISGMLLNTRILVCTGDVNNRLFGQWSFRNLNLAVSRMEEFNSSEAVEVVATEALTLIIKLAEHLSKLPKISLANTMDHLNERVPDLLVRQDLMEYILNSQGLNTPSTYLYRYTTPVEIVLESELTWPMQARLFPLNQRET
ncbi:testis-expressed protein 47-like [Acropora muricata]|uniref:testis-expressed protein 47-like n=1 Tax=Acropora muricata TaxID=159855 RepID=UPI001CF37424|nr:testis-expressed protein 47-like isoform X1 [Acropora millepora]